MSHLPKIILLLIFLLQIHAMTAQNTLQQDADSIVYIEKVSSLDELLGKFKGNLVYVDFWASWCSSCLAEFKPEPEPDAFMKSNHIVRLYIALERPESDSARQVQSMEKWKNTTRKYDLKGYHYYGLLFSDFMHGITEKIMKGKLSLPRFSIIDSGGVIVDRNAKRPSDTDGLIRELSKYLNRKAD
jgi:thiol-disulfide isomerase/thioredoxin